VLIPRTGRSGQWFEASPTATLLNSAVYWLAGVSLAAGWALQVLSFTSASTSIPTSFPDPFVLLVFSRAVIVVNGGRLRSGHGERFRPADLLKAISPRMRPLILFAVLAMVPALAISMSTQGAPDYDPLSHRYFFDDHSALTPTTRDTYLHAMVAQNRAALGVVLVFLSVAFAISSGERGSRRGQRG
jgi:hypothetical protein